MNTVKKLEGIVKVREDRRAIVLHDLKRAQAELETAQSSYLDKPQAGTDKLTQAQSKCNALEASLRAAQSELDIVRAELEAAQADAEHDAKIAALASLANEGSLSAKALVSSHHAAIEALNKINRDLQTGTASLIETQNNFRTQVEMLIGRPPTQSLLPQHQERERQQQQEYSAKLSELKAALEASGVSWDIALRCGGEGIGFNGVRPGVKIPEAGQWTVPLNYCLNANSGAQS
jgi:chromosome segregation ATPase